MKALGTYIYATPLNEEVETSSGFVLSGEDKAQQRFSRAKVVSVGHEIPDNVIKKDDIITYDKANSFTLISGGNTYVVMKIGSAIGIE